MYDPELEKAVALCKSDEPQPLKKHEQYERLKLFANRQRLPAESPQQALTRFITKTPEGQVLYKSFTEARGVSVPPVAKAADDNGGGSEGMKKLKLIAAELRKADPMLSPQQATALAIRTPAGAAAYLADKQARRIA